MIKMIYFRPVIICIVGPSGSGKTTMARFLEKAMDIPMLVSYTTRPMRDGEVNGVDHHFVTEDQMPPESEMLAYTNFGGYHYWTAKEDVPHTGIGMCTYVIDEIGLKMLAEKYAKDYNIFPILIKRDSQLLINQVGADRVKRDEKRMVIPEEEYSEIIENNGRIEDFLADAFKCIEHAFNIINNPNYGRTEH